MDSLLELFRDVDDFCPAFLPKWQKQLVSDGEIQQRKRQLSLHGLNGCQDGLLGTGPDG